MDAASWKRVLGSLRTEDLEDMMLVVEGGMEINVTEFARLEDDVAMIRGRAAGAEIGGRLFLIPYEGIMCLYVNRIIRTAEVQLYSPSIPTEDKARIAKEIEAQIEAERQQAENAGKKTDQPGVDPAELKRQLDELREAAGFNISHGGHGGHSAPPPPPAPAPKPAAQSPIALPGPAIPPRLNIPKGPPKK